jgi:4-amino-4-deoxy-L-arabinose transferase-like glycosyltransferase
VLAAIFALAVAVRAPFNGNSGVDEAYYLIIGRQWLHGLPPYAGAYDVKPPLLFLLMAGAEALFGPTLLAAKALTTASVAIAASGLYLLGRRFMSGLAGGAAALLYIFSSLNLGGTFSPAELIMAPFTTSGMLLGASALEASGHLRRHRLLVSGLLFGAAACIKQTALFEAVAFALVLLWTLREARLQACVAFATGFCGVPAGFALYFAAIGHFGDLVDLVAVSALQRAGTAYSPGWGEAVKRTGIDALQVLPAIIMAAGFWASSRRAGNRAACISRLLAAWTIGALTGLLSAGAMIHFYALTVLQPLCLTAGMFAVQAFGRVESPARQWIWRTAALGLSIYFSVWSAAALYLPSGDSPSAAVAAASAIRRQSKPGDRIFVADRDLLVYLAAGVDPAGPVFHPLQLLCDFPLPGADRAFAGAVALSPAFVVVADPALHLNCEHPERRAMLEARLVRDYCPLGRFGNLATAGRPGAFLVYGLKARIDPTKLQACERL